MPRSRNLYRPDDPRPFKLSRSRLERFIDCPRCFYLDRRLGIDRVSGPPFTLNSATDTLLKREFDQARQQQKPHAIMEEYNLHAVPFQHEELKSWRNNSRGIQYLHTETNLLIFGAIDDVWQNDQGELHVVDYKSTSTTKTISLDDPWKQTFKRQMEIYQWLLRMNGFEVSPIGYFVYVNADTTRPAFNDRLVFNTELIRYTGNSDWVEECIYQASSTLNLSSERIPSPNEHCEWCQYLMDAKKHQLAA